MILESTKRKLFTGFLASLALIFSLSTHQAKANPAAIAVIEDFHALLLDVMQQGEAIDFDERYARLETTIRDKLDMAMIGNVVLNRHWNNLGEDQQSLFIEVFLELSAATYADRFDSYSDQEFTTLGSDDMNAGRVLVRTEISGSDMDTVRLDYILHQVDGEWRIISAIADGVNDLALKRAEYTAIMNSDGFDGLIEEMRSQVSNLRNAP